MDAQKKKRKSVYNDQVNKRTQAYNLENYDRLMIRVGKSSDINKAVIEAAAAAAGESINAYVTEAVRRRINSEKENLK